MAETRPDMVTPTTPERRIAVQLAKAHFARRGVLRQLLRGNDDGHHGERDQHRHQHERGGRERVRQDQQELCRAEAAVQHQHVHGEQPAAIRAAGAIVEPAFGDHVNAGEAQSRDQAHGAPRHGSTKQP